MALLSQLMRQAAITGDNRRINAWFADRQGAEWAERTMGAAMPSRRGQELDALRRRGVLSDDEAARLRARLRL
jgi:hypothetical protein